MIKGLYTASYGMMPRITQQDAIANNLANMSTSGYKKSNMFMRELITADNALDHVLGRERSQVAEYHLTDFTQGEFNPTGNKFDLALNGPGFFRIRDDQGATLFSRSGQFHLDNNSYLVNKDNMFVLNDSFTPIQIRGDEVEIEGNGDIMVDGAYFQTIGLGDFAQNDYASLEGVGAELFRNNGNIQEIRSSEATAFMQGYLEESNVKSIDEMVKMIEIHRMFELGQKTIQIQDQSLQRVVTEVGVVR
ncbi:flagellar hook-basal body protein [Candidatus Latescibacterota bacterium]